MKAMKTAVLIGALCLGAGCANRPRLEGVYKDAITYEAGQDRTSLVAIETEIRGAKPEQYPAIEAKLLAILKARGTTVEAKGQVARYLGVVGSSKSAKTLAAMLKDEQLSHPARIALERMETPAAGRVLRKAMSQVKGTQLVGVISSVGARRDAAAITPLRKLAKNPDAAVASAAVAALGSIGNAKAAATLQSIATTAPVSLQPAIATALVNCADRMCRDGQCAAAAPIFRSLLNDKSTPAQRTAAANGLIGATEKSKVAELTIDLLQSDDAATRGGAVAALHACSDASIQSAVVAKLPTLKPAAQVAVLGILPEMKKAAAREALLTLVKSSADDIRCGAIAALAVHGDTADVPMLVKLASGPNSADKDAAKKALETLGHRGTDTALMGLLATDPASRKTVIAALAARRSIAALPSLTELLTGPDAAIAADAAAAIGTLGALDQLSTLTSLINTTGNEKLRSALEKAAGEICTRIADSKLTGPFVLRELEKAGSPPARVALLKLLPRVRGDEALRATRKATESDDAMIREAAIRALADWPEIAAAKHLFEVTKQLDNDRLAIIAMQGCIRLAGRKEASNADRLNVLKKVIEEAKRPEEKRQAVSGLGEVISADALTFTATFAEDKAFAADAARAAMRIAAQRNAPPKAQVLTALNKFNVSPAINADVKKQLAECIKQQDKK